MATWKFEEIPLSIDHQRKSPDYSEWMNIAKTPPSFRVGNGSIRLRYDIFRTKFFIPCFTVIVVISVLFILLPNGDARYTRGTGEPRFFPRGKTFVQEEDVLAAKRKPVAVPEQDTTNDASQPCIILPNEDYNATYPLTKPVRLPNGDVRYNIGVISDLDEASKSKSEPNKWLSFFLKGYLDISQDHSSAKFQFRNRITLEETLAMGGRGMELSELIVFNGNLYTFDDRTGVVFQIHSDSGKDIVVPWVVLPDGNGKKQKGFKAEWAAVKDKILYVGGLGKEWTTKEGRILNRDPQWVKAVSPSGIVTHLDWHTQYNALKEAAGITNIGYLIHESAAWSSHHNKWYFLPRRMSKERYNDVLDEKKGSNIMIIADENFQNIETRRIGSIIPTHGFSSFKFIPGTKDNLIVALKSEENAEDGSAASYIMVFEETGKILLEETKIGDFKYEGIEFI